MKMEDGKKVKVMQDLAQIVDYVMLVSLTLSAPREGHKRGPPIIPETALRVNHSMCNEHHLIIDFM